MTNLITGEAVVLDLRLARLASRSLALVIDLSVQVLTLFLGFLLLGALLESSDPALAAALGLTLVVAVTLGYPVTFETLTRGRSLGKLALGLRVVRDDGGTERFRHALMRGLVGFIEIWATFGVLALIASLLSAKDKRLGDQVAGTVVVRERMPKQGSPALPMPPGLAHWAAGLDLSRLPNDLALSARQFLGRAPQLAPDVRASMGVTLARAVSAYATPLPPPGVPPEPYLAAVLAERRGREFARLQHPGSAPPLGSATAWPGSAGPPSAGVGSVRPYASQGSGAPAAPTPAAPPAAAPPPAPPSMWAPSPSAEDSDPPFAPPG